MAEVTAGGWNSEIGKMRVTPDIHQGSRLSLWSNILLAYLFAILVFSTDPRAHIDVNAECVVF